MNLCTTVKESIRSRFQRLLLFTGPVFLLTFLSSVANSHAAQATLSWTAPTTYTDGSPVTSQLGYKVHAGSASGNYSQTVDVGNATSYTLGNLSDGATYYFAVTAYDASGDMSGFSNQVAYATPPAAPATALYTITASAGSGGSITPSGAAVISQGTSQTYSITPASGYNVAGVSIDGVSVGAVSTYTFSNVAANHTITATFAAATTTFTITESDGSGGICTPTGVTTVNSGGSQTYTVTAYSGYQVANVVVDGISVGAVSSYTFSNITANHTIAITFAAVTGSLPSIKAVHNDFDGDGKTDIAVFRPGTGQWLIMPSSTGVPYTVSWGTSGDIAVPGDYDGDGKTDVAVFRPSEGNWYIMNSSTGKPSVIRFGTKGDIPVPGDYDGDGKTDIAVFRPSEGNWYIMNSSTGTQSVINYGINGDIPVPGDYDGDGKTDIAVWRPSNGNWFVKNSSTGTQSIVNYGISGDTPVPGDYDGDGKTDVAVWRNGTWFVINSATGTQSVANYGIPGDIPVPGDYDGAADIAVWRPSAGNWYIKNNSSGTQRVVTWGAPTDLPVK